MLISILEQSFILGIMVFGVYITYKVLNFPDLSTDGSFTLGGAIVATLLINDVNPSLSIILSGIGGALAGALTGVLHTKFKITNILSGILVMTALYSINLRVMGKSNIPLFSIDNIFGYFEGEYSNTLLLVTIVLFLILILTFFFKTKFGFLIRVLGDNEHLITTLGISTERLKIVGLALGNFLVAISGALFAQYQGFSDVGMGVGIVIIGLASIILGEILCSKATLISPLIAVIIGSFFYRVIISLSLSAGLQATDLKLLTAVIIIGVIFFKNRLENLKKGGKNAKYQNS